MQVNSSRSFDFGLFCAALSSEGVVTLYTCTHARTEVYNRSTAEKGKLQGKSCHAMPCLHPVCRLQKTLLFLLAPAVLATTGQASNSAVQQKSR